MENASRAIIIAGGILLGMIIVGFMIIGYNNIREYKQAEERSKEEQQVVDQNKKFESFDKTVVRGNDIISLTNLANSTNALRLDKDSNGKYIIDGYPEVKIWLSMSNEHNNGAQLPQMNIKQYKDTMKASGNNLKKDGKTYYLMNTYMEMLRKEEDVKYLNSFKTLFFECDVVEYDSYGYVKAMYFTNIVQVK